MTTTWPEAPTAANSEVLKAVHDAAVEATPDRDPASVTVHPEPLSGVPVLEGSLPTWDDVVRAGHAASRRWLELRGTNTGDVVVDAQPVQSEPAPVAPSRPTLHAADLPDSADVVIVGAGICGTMIGHHLQKAGLDVLIVDAALEIAEATTSWNNGMVHPGHDPKPGTLKAELNIAGNTAWAAVMHEMGLPFERRPSLVVGFGESDLPRLGREFEKAQKNGVPGAALISGEQAREIEPRLSRAVSGALLLPTTASVDPVAVSQALVTELRSKGSLVSLAAPVTRITTDGRRRVTGVEVLGTHVGSAVVVNVAGVLADELSATAGSRRYSIHPRRGSLVLFDPGDDDRYLTSVGPIPGEYSKGGGMTARPSGLTTGGPTAVEQQSHIAHPPTQAEIDHILALGEKIYPAFPLNSIVHLGSAVRAVTYSEDFLIGPAPGFEGLIDVAGTQSPAIAAAPAIAERVVQVLRTAGRLPQS